LSNLKMSCRVHPALSSKTPEFELLADTCSLALKHGMVLEADHAARIAGSTQKNRLCQGNGHGSPDAGSIRLFTVRVCAVSNIKDTSRRRAQVPPAGAVLAKFQAAEWPKWGKMIQAAGIERE